jgi:beta-aspartyl-dipeptidase (metallo-type)
MPVPQPHPPDAALTLLRNADVYAPAPLGRRHVLVGGGRVLWIGERLPALPAALGVAEVELDGAPLVPGLVDAHAHLTGGGGARRGRTRGCRRCRCRASPAPA